MANDTVPTIQSESEIVRLVRLLKSNLPERPRILEIGSLYGGTLLIWMANFPGAQIVSLDILDPARREEALQWRAKWDEWAEAMGCELSTIIGDSHAELIIEQVRALGPFDFIFVDGDHTLEGVTADCNNYWPMLAPGGIMAFHDANDYLDDTRCRVAQFWTEYKREHNEWVMEIFHEDNRRFGIGVIKHG